MLPSRISWSKLAHQLHNCTPAWGKRKRKDVIKKLPPIPTLISQWPHLTARVLMKCGSYPCACSHMLRFLLLKGDGEVDCGSRLTSRWAGAPDPSPVIAYQWIGSSGSPIKERTHKRFVCTSLCTYEDPHSLPLPGIANDAFSWWTKDLRSVWPFEKAAGVMPSIYRICRQRGLGTRVPELFHGRAGLSVAKPAVETSTLKSLSLNLGFYMNTIIETLSPQQRTQQQIKLHMPSCYSAFY